MKLIETSHLKPITVKVEQLLINSYNNPLTGKPQEQIEAYQEEVKHFGYFDLPIVYKADLIWTNTDQEYLVLTNVQEVETRKSLGLPDMNVLEIDDKYFTPDDAFRFALHRSSFHDLSNESRYEAFKKVYDRLEKNRDWAMTIKTNDGRTISKVSKITGLSVGIIHDCMTIGKKNKSLLQDVDNKKISFASAYRKVMNKDPLLKTPKGKRRTFKSRYEGYANEYEKKAGNTPLPAELKFSITENGELTKFILNDIVLEGYRAIANNIGDGITQIKFESEKEPFVVTIQAPYMEEWFKEKGFSTESPREKLVVPFLTSKSTSSTSDFDSIILKRNTALNF